MESRYGRVTTDSKTIKPILKQYGIIDPDDTLKEAAICRYILKNLLKSQRDSKSKVDEETSSKVKLKEVLKKYKQVIDKFSGDIFGGIALKAPEDKVKLSFGKYVPNDTEVLMKNCEELASYYKLNDLYSYSSYSQAANAELNKLYGEISYQNSALERIRTDSTRIAYCDKVLTELLKDNYKPHHQADEGGIGEDSVSDTVINKLDGWFNKNQGIENVDKYLDNSSGLISIGASDKDLKKWYGYVKGKIKDLNVVIKEYSPKISWDNSYWEEAKFISMLYILSRSVERADKNKREPLAEYLQELGANMYLNGKYIPGSIKDPAAVKKAAYKLYKVCTDSIKAYRNRIKARFSGFTMNKKQCIKILDCISSTDRGTDIDADTMKNLRILEKKIKSKLKAN